MSEEIESIETRIAGYDIKQMGFVIAGLVLTGIGIWGWKVWGQDKARVEIITSGDKLTDVTGNPVRPKVKVDISGAVMKPGVYELDMGSRVDDALIAAGGLKADADREWVDKYINKAQKVSDGIKLYIPIHKEFEKIANEGISTQREVVKVNVNTASSSELEDLWGIGEATAKKIIQSRPYSDIDDLVTRKLVKQSVFEKIKDEITIY